MLHYRRFDHSPAAPWVVFVHGAGGSSSIWYRQVRDFKERFNVLLVDLRGHGQSQQDDEAGHYTFEERARDILAVLDDAGVERAHFVGISLGCILIRTLGEIAPERVASMTLGGAVVRLDLRSRFLVGAGNLFKRVLPYLWLYRLFAWIIMPRKRHRTSRTLFVGEAKKLCQREFLRWFRLTGQVNPLLRFFREKELHVPTLYVMGEEDYLFLPPVEKVVEQHEASSRLVVISESGHVCNVDQPEAFNRATIGFIEALHARAA